LYFIPAPGFIGLVTLVENGPVHLVHYCVHSHQAIKSEHFNIARRLGGEEDLKSFMRQHPNFSQWKPISKKDYQSLYRATLAKRAMI
jgi:hypothetical protein